MISLITPCEALETVAKTMRQRRLQLNITQVQLSERSGVSLAVLRKFERTGKISIESFLKLALVLGVMQEILDALAIKEEVFTSIDEVLEDHTAKRRKRARP